MSNNSADLSDLIRAIKALSVFSRAHSDVSAKPDAQVLFNKLEGNLASIQKMLAPVPKVKVLVMPDATDKNSFALEAMADAMGLRIVEAEVPAVEPVKEFITPEGTFPEPEFKPVVFHLDVPKMEPDSSGQLQIPFPIVNPTHELVNGKWVEKVTYPADVIISKKTGMPKRPYVKSGKFTAEAKASAGPKRPYRKLRKS